MPNITLFSCHLVVLQLGSAMRRMRATCLQLMEHYLHTSACLVLASVVVASGRLPPKLNCVIQNLMAGLRKEPCRWGKGLGQRDTSQYNTCESHDVYVGLWLRVLAVVYMACQTYVVSLSNCVEGIYSIIMQSINASSYGICRPSTHRPTACAYLAQWLFMWLLLFLCVVAGSCRLLLRQRWLS
jgi:hypothetical protein